MQDEIPTSLELKEIIRYSKLIEQVIACAKSLTGSAVGTTHEMPKVKLWIGDAYWEANLGAWRRLR